jgi:uroporphyrin-III C-methyltransferase
MAQKNGKVYLVGAGPADPELITKKGARLLARAGCVIYDRLINRELLKVARPGCEKIYAGKSSDEKGRGQRRINRLLADKAGKHSVIVRLKGGDPALFGRMSEEIEMLEKAGIPYEVVPGVSSVWAAASALGIPLTDRRFSSSVAFVTGHRAAAQTELTPGTTS